MNGFQQITHERTRQIIEERWTLAHDDTHTKRELRIVAAIYATPGRKRRMRTIEAYPAVSDTVRRIPRDWPADWHWSWWKPTPRDRVRELVKAGALYLAEADRCARRGQRYTAMRMQRRAKAIGRQIDRILKGRRTS